MLAISIALLLSVSMTSMAATVEYRHPDLTIVAKDEPLQSVLKSVREEMQIFVTMPTGINPVVSCDIQNQSIKRALKRLLGELSYSLEWEGQSGRLVGLTILSSDGDAVATAVSKSSSTPGASQASPVVVTSGNSQAAVIGAARADHDRPTADQDAQRAEQEARMEVEREEREARMAEQREAHEAEMAVLRQEQEIEHEARMEEDIARKQAEEATLFAEEAARRP
jgi:hypothetical protein